MNVIARPEVTQLVANISAIYSPELKVGFTCCSDHQSFHEQGYPATHLFERAGPIAYPMYHNSWDLSDRRGYDLNQVCSIYKVQVCLYISHVVLAVQLSVTSHMFATFLHASGFDLPKALIEVFLLGMRGTMLIFPEPSHNGHHVYTLAILTKSAFLPEGQELSFVRVPCQFSSVSAPW
ncbi:hypothetical protein EDC04DRAFT_1213028 [Pisolithus marmoratus]|nr:hypothetical protein EDC04DRAFT_1213028 [Pisolithus marmoratus]